ncbi:unnamed protein product [Lactuca saligna]|uniref:Uncharacterized protein n=1 Tax=Lactuca saligna TaxID=75948 RepID=A0AA36A010_LACSI|nr:unnamed protein product [Lactuca saligna]
MRMMLREICNHGLLKRIVKLIVKLMRNHNTHESLLLETTARAIQPMLEWGESGMAAADELSNLFKCRLHVTIRCLSHPSAHVRALSTSVLRVVLYADLINPSGFTKGTDMCY